MRGPLARGRRVDSEEFPLERFRFGTFVGSDLCVCSREESVWAASGKPAFWDAFGISGTTSEKGFLCLSLLIWVCEPKGGRNWLLSGALPAPPPPLDSFTPFFQVRG